MINKEERILELVEIWNKKYPKTEQKIRQVNKKTLLQYRLNGNMGSNVWDSIKKDKAGRHWETLVGYTLNDLIRRLRKTMPNGYNWQDYLKGKLHIDHIIPKRAFTFKTSKDEEFKQCWSLYNLRLLPANKNKSKQDSLSPILLGLLLSNLTRNYY